MKHFSEEGGLVRINFQNVLYFQYYITYWKFTQSQMPPKIHLHAQNQEAYAMHFSLLNLGAVATIASITNCRGDEPVCRTTSG
jgi:hypothetical protein